MVKPNGFGDKQILKALAKLLIYDKPAEQEAVLVECPELLTVDALAAIRFIVASIPDDEPIKVEWVEREKFLAGKIPEVHLQ